MNENLEAKRTEDLRLAGLFEDERGMYGLLASSGENVYTVYTVGGEEIDVIAANDREAREVAEKIIPLDYEVCEEMAIAQIAGPRVGFFL